MLVKHASSKAARLVTDEKGGITVLSLFLFTCCLMLGGLALDTSRAQATIALMQNTADNAAHAALYNRITMTESEAKSEAIDIVTRNMPSREHGVSVSVQDVEFGNWNSVQKTFVPAPGSRDAVRVTVRRTQSMGNALPTFLLKFAGLPHWDLERRAVMVSADAACLREGFASDTLVDMQSGNSYTQGFCIHSNGRIKISQNNFFEKGVSVSLPRMEYLDVPSGDIYSNAGFADALDFNRYNMKIIERLGAVYDGLATANPRYLPAYITSPQVINANRSLDETRVTRGRIHNVNCTGNQSLTIGGVLADVVILTNCRIQFSQGARLENVVVATTNTDKRSINGPNGVQFGRNDNCGTGGGAQILTMGGMEFASNLQTFGAQLLARGDIAFQAASGGVQGAAFVAGGAVLGKSGMNLAGCGGRGMEQNFVEPYLRLVE